MTDNQTDNNEEAPKKKLSPMQLLSSLAAGAVGVQSGKNRERDFQSASLPAFIIGGIIFTLIFIGSIVGVVHYFLSTAK